MRTARNLLSVLVVALAASSYAAEYDVETTADGADPIPGDGVCDDGFGNCTLRAAVQTANANAGPDEVVLPAGLYVLTLKRDPDLPDEQTGDLDVTGDLTITGAGNTVPCAGVGCTSIDGKKGKDRVFDVNGPELRLESLSVKNGKAAKGDFNPGQINEEISGGLIRVASRLETDAVVLEGGSSPDDGGCIGFVDGSTGSLENTLIRDCSAKDGGGAIEADFADVVLERVTLAGSKGSEGGAMEISGGTLDLANTTLSGNSAKEGGAVEAEDGAELTINNASFVNNKSKDGAAIHNENAAMVEISNSLLRTAGKENNCSGPITSEGGNLENGTLCNFSFAGGDCPDCNPDVSDDLADNGGPVPTHAIGANSEAINLGENASCEATDARFAPRVGNCDAGAYEFGGVVP
jgi:CSLREA domain-containing protein